MSGQEKDIMMITDFEQAAQDPAIQQQLNQDAAFRESFEAQRAVQSILSISASAQIPSDIQIRIRAGALRQIRSVEPDAHLSSAWSKLWEWKLVWGAVLLLVLAVPAIFNQDGSLTPVTEFTYESTSEIPTVEVAIETAPMQIASNNLQNAPIQVMPVRYDLP